jgi:CHAT domain-containing protein
MESEENVTERDIHDRGVIREYLLCRLAGEQIAESVESALFTDDEYAAVVESVEDELIEDYLDGTLERMEADGFETRLRNSSELRQKVALVKGLRKFAARDERTAKTTSEPRRWTFFRPSFALRFAAVAVVFAFVGVIVWQYAVHQSEADVALARLQRSVAGQRVAEGRTSLQTAYAPLIVTRGAEQPAGTPNREFLSAKAALLKAVADDPDNAGVHHSLGLMYLAEGDLTNALGELKEAEKLGLNNAAIFSDIGTAYLERSSRPSAPDERIRDRALALEYTEKSLSVDPSRIETLFNRALVLEAMDLTLQARQAWRDYLARDPNSEWAAEARRRLERLDSSESGIRTPDDVLKDFWAAYENNDRAAVWRIVSETKELITDSMVFSQLTGKVLEADERGDAAGVEQNLKGMKFAADIESANSADLFFTDLFRYYAAAGRQTRLRVKEAADELRLGYNAVAANGWEDALARFETAAAMYRNAGDHWDADIAEYQVSYVLTQMNRLDESTRRLNEMAARNRRKQYKWPVTLADGWIGSNFTLAGEHSNALAFSNSSLAAAEEAKDSYNQQRALNQLTHQYYWLGDEDQTLATIDKTLTGGPGYFQSQRQRSRNLLFASQGFYRFGYLAAAASFANEQMILARDILKDRWLLHTAHFNRAHVFLRAKNYPAALAEAEQCLRIAESFEDASMRKRQQTKTLLLRADIQREMQNCPEAIENYGKVIADYETSEFAVSLYEARKGRLICYIELDRRDAVTAEMADVIELFEKNRKTIAAEAERNIFFNREQSVYDIAAEYAYAKLKDPALAFSYAESSRARSLLNRMSGDSSALIGLEDLRRKIPSGVGLLYYAVLPRRTLMWALTAGEVRVFDLPVSGSQLRDDVSKFRQSVIERAYSVDSSAALHELLLSRLEFPAETALYIVPDKSLFQLPFAALRSRETGRFLIEDFPIAYAPSASVFAGLVSGVGLRPALPSDQFYGLAATEFDGDANPRLRNIDDAKREVTESARFYGDAIIVSGHEATKKAFWDGLEKGDVLHVAGHYVANRLEPAESKLLLSDGEIRAAEILDKRKVRPRLVVLSACESGIEAYHDSEGMIGAGRAFLASGVPLVIGSQWPVDSAATADLIVAFHLNRARSKLDGLNSLRSAQLATLRDPAERREPYFWAGIMPIGIDLPS